MSRIYAQSSASRPIPITMRRMSGTVTPIRLQASQLRKDNTETIRPFQNPVAHTTAQPTDYLSQSPDFTWPISYSSSPTSDAIASTAAGSVMSRSNTDDVLSGTIGMPRADSNASHCNYSRIVEVTSDDGTLRHKAEIPRITRPQPQRKTTFCHLCDDHPQGFHGEHELRRHVERHHPTYRKVWICKDNTLTDGRRPAVPLSNCKACRNHKTYGANYNAAAHLRRAHFFPCKNKRGGRGKISEGRGGMGGGEEPPMDELKNWMYEKIEIVAGNVLQSTSPELSQIDTGIFTEFDQFDDAVSYNHLALSIPQESANSYDWSATQFPVDLVSESIQFINSVID
jgi:hypothetical protein